MTATVFTITQFEPFERYSTRERYLVRHLEASRNRDQSKTSLGLADIRLCLSDIQAVLTSSKEADDLASLQHLELLTLDQTARLLNISKSSLENLITAKTKTGKPSLKTVRPEGTRLVRIARADLTDYVKRLRAGSR